MIKTENYFLIFLISLLGFIPFVPSFRSIDVIAPNYLYLALCQLLISIYLFRKKTLKVQFNTIDFAYIVFLVVSLFSFIKSFNINESIIEWSQFLTLFITYFNLKTLFKLTQRRETYLLIILLSLVTIESSVIFYEFLKNYTTENGLGRVRNLQGLSPNLNIGAFSLLIKIPFIIYYYSKSRSLKIKVFMTFLLLITTFCILIISSRGAIMGLLIFFFLFLLLEIFQKTKGFKFKLTFYFLISTLVLVSVQSILYSSNKELISTNRITNLIDRSSLDRIEYYKASVELFFENPFLGVGIGNWKISSLTKLGRNIFDYTVPYHAHNDILQIGSEIGFIGLIAFITILIYPIFYVLRGNSTHLDKNQITPFLIIALVSFILDSTLNFPRIRPYSQVNFIYILSFFSSNILTPFKNKYNVKFLSVIFILVLLPLNFLHSKFLMSYREVFNMHVDFNTNSNSLQIPIDVIKNYQDTYPNMTSTLIPIKLVKANYYLQMQEYDTVLKLVNEGKKVNPYLGFGDLLLSKAFYQMGMKDSAFVYIQKAYNKIPLNAAHVTLYQDLLINFKEYDKLREIFETTKILKREEIWTNHFAGIIEDPQSLVKGFSAVDSLNIKQALKLFPSDRIFNSFDLIITGGIKAALEAEKLDVLATNQYNKKEYVSAIKYWDAASRIIPNEDSYLLNIALSYCQISEFQKSLNTLKIIEGRNIKSLTGQFEFISGYSFLELGKTNLACQYLRESVKLGNALSKNLLQRINCQTN